MDIIDDIHFIYQFTSYIFIIPIKDISYFAAIYRSYLTYFLYTVFIGDANLFLYISLICYAVTSELIFNEHLLNQCTILTGSRAFFLFENPNKIRQIIKTAKETYFCDRMCSFR